MAALNDVGVEVVVASPLLRRLADAEEAAAKPDAEVPRASVGALRDRADFEGLVDRFIEGPVHESMEAQMALQQLCRDSRERLERLALRLIPLLNPDSFARGRAASFLGGFSNLVPRREIKSLLSFLARSGVFEGLRTLLADPDDGVAQNAAFAVALITIYGLGAVEREAHAADLCPGLLELLGREAKGARTGAVVALRNLCMFSFATRARCREYLAANPNAAILLRRAEEENPGNKVSLEPAFGCCVIA